jgi:hypothetical protein
MPLSTLELTTLLGSCSTLTLFTGMEHVIKTVLPTELRQLVTTTNIFFQVPTVRDSADAVTHWFACCVCSEYRLLQHVYSLPTLTLGDVFGEGRLSRIWLCFYLYSDARLLCTMARKSQARARRGGGRRCAVSSLLARARGYRR